VWNRHNEAEECPHLKTCTWEFISLYPDVLPDVIAHIGLSRNSITEPGNLQSRSTNEKLQNEQLTCNNCLVRGCSMWKSMIVRHSPRSTASAAWLAIDVENTNTWLCWGIKPPIAAPPSITWPWPGRGLPARGCGGPWDDVGGPQFG